MTKSEVLKLLADNQNERGIKHWQTMGDATQGLTSYGIGLTQLRKLAKKIGRNHQLALQLWASDCYDAKVIGLLIDEPKKMTREQVEAQVEQLHAGMLSHVFSSCDATLPKAPFAFEVTNDWLASKDEARRRSAYGLVYELCKNTRLKALTDAFFLDCIKRIDRTIDSEENWVRLAQGGALMGMGKRNKMLNQAAIKVAQRVGPIDYQDGDRKCEPLDVMKHLTSEYLQKKLA